MADASRRYLLQCLLFGDFASALLADTPRGRFVQNTAPFRPDPTKFESGDLLWPKPRGAWVPYSSATTQRGERTKWEGEKERYLDRFRAATSLTPSQIDIYQALQRLTFDQFTNVYLADSSADDTTPFGLDRGLYVGHVAVLDIDGAAGIDVIEALDGLNVRRTSYTNWLSERSAADIWHGRVNEADPTARKRIATTAASFLGRPYNFWNFDLSDDSDFYCSKLVWLAALKAVGYALDDDRNARRALWYSPKRCMRSRHIRMIFSPGPYATR